MSKKVLFGLGAVIVAVAGVVIYKKVTKNNEVDEDQELSDLLAENEEVIDALENMILEDELDDDETEEEDDDDEVEEELIEDSIPSDFNNKIEKYYLQDLIDCIKDDEIKSNIMNEYTNICFDIEKEASENGGEMKPSATLKELKVKIKEIIKNQ